MKKSATTIAFFFFCMIAGASASIRHPNTPLKKRNVTGPVPPPPPFVPTFNEEQRAFLDAHNELRDKSGVPPLVWDADLTESAHDWAIERRGDCNYRNHSTTNKNGENIYFLSYNDLPPGDIVKKWFAEKQYYDFKKKACTCHPEKEGCECGHYLNVIWSTTKRVGCSGVVYCKEQKGVYVVCQYDPAGLIKGVNPFNGKKI